MSILAGFLESRCFTSFQRVFNYRADSVIMRFSSSRSNFEKYVGAPECPIPGTSAYAESMERLQDPRFLEMLSSKNSENLQPSDIKIQQWMRVISEQNAQLLLKVTRLTQKIEELESRNGIL